jgi:magnesium-transporting ATPase (P-type)
MAAPPGDHVGTVASSEPWCDDATTVVGRLATDAERGLSTSDAGRRLGEHGPNALALGMDPPPDDVMARSPRRLTDRVIDAEMQQGIAFVGLVMAVVTLVALDLRLPGGLIDGSGDIVEARTMAFTTLVLAQLYNCFNARSDRVSAFHQLFTNPLLWSAVAVSLGLQIAVVHVPVLNDAFDTAPLTAGEWATCVALASAVLWAGELRKLVGRGRQSRPT